MSCWALARYLQVGTCINEECNVEIKEKKCLIDYLTIIKFCKNIYIYLYISKLEKSYCYTIRKKKKTFSLVFRKFEFCIFNDSFITWFVRKSDTHDARSTVGILAIVVRRGKTISNQMSCWCLYT